MRQELYARAGEGGDGPDLASVGGNGCQWRLDC